MNIKTKITNLHYTRNPKGILFEILKFCSYFYGAGSHFKNFMYDKKILRPKKVNAFVYGFDFEAAKKMLFVRNIADFT